MCEREWAASPRFQGSARCFIKLQAMSCSTCLFAPARSLPPSPRSKPPAYLETMHITVQHLV